MEYESLDRMSKSNSNHVTNLQIQYVKLSGHGDTAHRKEERNITLIMLGHSPPAPITIFKNNLWKIKGKRRKFQISRFSASPGSFTLLKLKVFQTTLWRSMEILRMSLLRRPQFQIWSWVKVAYVVFPYYVSAGFKYCTPGSQMGCRSPPR